MTGSNVKYALIKADLDSLDEEFTNDGLSYGLKNQVQSMFTEEMDRVRTKVYSRVKVQKVQRSYIRERK